MNKFGFARVSVVSPICSVGNPEKNADEIISILNKTRQSDVVVFPELCITGYTCADLFRQELLLRRAEEAVTKIVKADHEFQDQLIFVGAPVAVDGQLYNCAICIHEGEILGIVPKTNIPNYNEFYESRWFRGADGSHDPVQIRYGGPWDVPFGTDLMFKNKKGLVVFAEICEDVWMPIPPSSVAAINGANLLVNLSASNETVAKSEYRTDLVKNQSGRCVAAYAYSSAGPSESTTDLVFGGHCLIAENSHLLKESRRVGDGQGLIKESQIITADIDVEKLQTERRTLSSFGESRRLFSKEYRIINFEAFDEKGRVQHGLCRKVNGRPFVPSDPETLGKRCTEIFDIQVSGLARRLQNFKDPNKKVYIGVSGGLDSTLALLVAAQTYRSLGWDVSNIVGITMPGFGTTSRTKNNAVALMNALGVAQKEIDIRQACLESFKSMKHDPFEIGMFHPSCNTKLYSVECFENTLQHLSQEQINRGDLVFENVQARIRTMILMSHGFVLGTGDLSELALGWCTYNGDHMSMYNVNCSIPKTLVKFLVDYVADYFVDFRNGEVGRIPDPTGKLYTTLKDIVDTTISPELLPHLADKITQSTEDNIGPYELHDFYLVNFVRNGFSPEKILFLANYAEFEKSHSIELRERTLKLFLKRFFNQQFKRSCVPDGPKVGSVSLSPRGDWRMPSDADVGIWLNG